MRRIAPVLISACLFYSFSAFAQQGIKLTAYAGTGFSFFGGPGSASQSHYFRNGLNFPNGVDTIANHFGKMVKTNFMAGVQLERPLTVDWSLSVSAQFESVGAHLKSDSLISPAGDHRISGNYWVDYNFISLNPQIQRIISNGSTQIAVHGGLDYAIKVSLSDHFEYVDHNGINTSVGHSGGKPEVNDLRLTAGVQFSFAKWEVDLNYKHGLSDYNKNGNGKAGMRLMQVRLGYRI